MKKKKILRTTIGLLFVLGILLAFFLRLDKKISLHFLQEHHQIIQDYIANNYELASILYIIFYIAFVILMIPLTILLNVASGYFFGTLPGTLYSVLGSAFGSLASLLIFRYILRTWAHKRYHAKLMTVENEFNKHEIGYILSMQLFPITPFAIINILAGLSTIPAWKFLAISFVGVTPYIFLNAFAGRKLVELNSIKDIVSPGFLILFLGLSLCALAPTLLQCIKKKLKKQ